MGYRTDGALRKEGWQEGLVERKGKDNAQRSMSVDIWAQLRFSFSPSVFSPSMPAHVPILAQAIWQGHSLRPTSPPRLGSPACATAFRSLAARVPPGRRSHARRSDSP